MRTSYKVTGERAERKEAMKTDGTSTGRLAIALAAAVLAAVLAVAGPARAQNAPTYGDCATAWYDSDASEHCPAPGTQFWFDTPNGECSVTARCRKLNGVPSIQQTVTGDLDDMSDLVSCDGILKIGSCLSASQQTALVSACEGAWDSSDASQRCGSSHGSHSVSTYQGVQCHVSTSCGTLAVAASFYGSPDDVKQLDFCNNGLSTSCPTVEKCTNAWNASSAKVTCNYSGVFSTQIEVDSEQCSVKTHCERLVNDDEDPFGKMGGSVAVETSYKGNLDQVTNLKNCDGTLRTSC